MNHVLEVDGYFYTSAERLMDGVMFQVHITEDQGDLTITDVTNSTSDAAFLKRFKMKPLRKEVWTAVQSNIDHLRKVATDQGKTLSDLLDEWERDYPDESRIDLVQEV